MAAAGVRSTAVVLLLAHCLLLLPLLVGQELSCFVIWPFVPFLVLQLSSFLYIWAFTICHSLIRFYLKRKVQVRLVLIKQRLNRKKFVLFQLLSKVIVFILEMNSIFDLFIES